MNIVEKMIRGCCTVDTTAPEPPEVPVPLVLPDGVVFNTANDPRAVIIFDDSNRKTQEDLKFLFGDPGSILLCVNAKCGCCKFSD